MRPEVYLSGEYRNDLRHFIRKEPGRSNGPTPGFCFHMMGVLRVPGIYEQLHSMPDFLATCFALNLLDYSLPQIAPAEYLNWCEHVVPFVDIKTHSNMLCGIHTPELLIEAATNAAREKRWLLPNPADTADYVKYLLVETLPEQIMESAAVIRRAEGLVRSTTGRA